MGTHDAALCLLGFTRAQWLTARLTQHLNQAMGKGLHPPSHLNSTVAQHLPYSQPTDEPGQGPDPAQVRSSTGLGTQADALHLGRGPGLGNGNGKHLWEVEPRGRLQPYSPWLITAGSSRSG